MKTLLVTGGSRGIGAAIAVEAARTGYDRVVVHYHEHGDDAKRVCDTLHALGKEATAIHANFVNPDEIDAMMDEVEKLGAIDGLVHAAAINVFKPLHNVRINQWDLCMSASTRSFLQIGSRAKPLMSSGGSIVAISSLGSTRALPHYGPMGPLKAALDAIVRQLAFEFGPDGIRVNAISPGLVQTTSIQRFPNPETIIQRVKERTPLGGRIATVDDIAPVAAFLLSPQAGWITGQTIVIDGGFSLT